MISLGQASNYSARQVFGHLFAWGTAQDSTRLRNALAKRYQVEPNQVALYHTGRSALAVAIAEVAHHQPTNVIVPGLTCIAVIRAIKAAGCRPVFVDIRANDLAYNYKELAKKLESLASESGLRHQASLSGPRHQANLSGPQDQAKPGSAATECDTSIDKNDKVCYNGSIILVQNTLGITWDIAKIQSLASKHHAKIIEDLAHCAGRLYPDGREVGTIGEAAALSFGKGKAIDTISGGAVILRHRSVSQPTQKPRFADRFRDRWYPLYGAEARIFGKLGRLLMGCRVKLHLVQRSADAELNLDHRLTHWQAKLALRQLSQLPTTRLRNYRLVSDRTRVLDELKQSGYDLTEIWYDTPVSPKRYAKEADFPVHECPKTVEISQQIVNLPTWYPPTKLQAAYEIIKKYEVK